MKIVIDEATASQLLLDDENPRLPEELRSRTQQSLLSWIANEYNTIEVARSMAEHGYFDSEPMIAIRSGRKLKIVEGNRRLTAVKVLLDEELRSTLDLNEREEWEELASTADLEDRFPVHIARNRRAVAPIIGYRHIAGIEPWEPWAKARFIASQVEKERLPFSEVARIVGEDESDVRAHYRNFRVTVDAERRLKVSARRVKDNFGFFTRAMNSAGLREHIGAPAPSEVRRGKPVLRAQKKKEVTEVFSWLFGDDKNEPVVRESRQISELGHVVSSKDALRVLRQSRDLEDALMASGGIRGRLLKRLNSALQSLQKAELDALHFRGDADVTQLLDECADVMGRLREG